MNAQQVMAHSGHDQLHLGDILLKVSVTSPTSHNCREVEQKYLFSKNRGKCQDIYQAREFQVAGVIGRKDGRPFDGVDHYFTTTKANQYFAFRYRTGTAGVNRRVGLKVKDLGKQSIARDEFEFDMKPEVSEESVFKFLRVVAIAIGRKVCESQIRVTGQIRYTPVSSDGKQKIEVVVFTGTNLQTGSMVCVGEIEAHGFVDETEAKLAILEYEQALGWWKFQTNQSMSQLLE